MSQYPPPPPSNVPPGMMPPPPLGGGYGMAPGPQRTSGAAVASLIFGILGCVPWLTGLTAVILGIVGLKSTKDPRVSGRGMAIAGLILGGISILAWTAYFSLVGAAVFGLWHGSAAQREVARQFLTDLSKQDVVAASSKTTSAVPKEEVQALADQVKPWGSLNDTTILSTGVAKTPDRAETTLAGSATFAQGKHGFSMRLVKEGDQWKIEKVDIQ